MFEPESTREAREWLLRACAAALVAVLAIGVGECHYFSNEADRIVNEDFTNEQANTYLLHQDHQIDILKRFDQMRKKDQRLKDVLVSLRMGLHQSDEAESRGKSAQPYRDKCVIDAAIFKNRDKWGPGGSMQVEELAGRTVKQALARLRERSQPEPPDERESPETVEEAPDTAESPGPMLRGRRRAQGGACGAGYSAGSRKST